MYWYQAIRDPDIAPIQHKYPFILHGTVAHLIAFRFFLIAGIILLRQAVSVMKRGPSMRKE
jgi:hypothetical protein